MYLKEVIIDGFKSYANRTIVSGFDSQFNAITGLNGSGKSNILDAICFVLGISNLSQVRVHSLNELVYKSGQSRISRASVSLIFDNSNPEQSPVGYESEKELTITRQIVIGGTNKYLINGRSAQLNRIQNLFHSVQLNVNNPHFLIMQGRITKVVNMKPNELLALIEEAAGTRMFENKKLAALKTIQNKQCKVEEINKLLAEEINPQLEKLRHEKSAFTAWSNKKTQIERLARYIAAYLYFEAERSVNSGDEIIQLSNQDIDNLNNSLETMKQSIQDTERQISALKQSQALEKASPLEAEVNSSSKDLVKLTAAFKNKQQNYHNEANAKNTLISAINEAKVSISKKEAEISAYHSSTKSSEDCYKSLQTQWNKLKAQELGITTNSADQQGAGLAGELLSLNNKISELTATMNQTQCQLKHFSQEKKLKSNELTKQEKQFQSLNQTKATKVNELEQTKLRLAELNYDEKSNSSSGEELAAAQDNVSKLREEANKLSARLSKINFEYKACKDINASSVHGLVARLIEVSEENSKYCKAIEVAAGGKLFNVVVDNELTGKNLLEKGELKKRVTIIPLNKISAKTISPAVINEAEKLVGAENVQTALSLVCYEQHLSAAISFVLGNSFICKDSAVASKVTFNPNINTRSITVDGDIHDPQGLLEGGATNQSASLLSLLNQAKKLEKLSKQEEAKIERLEHDLARNKTLSKEFKELTARIELLSHEVAAIQQRLSGTPYAKLSNEIKELEEQSSKTLETREQSAQQIKMLKLEARSLEEQIAQAEESRETAAEKREKQMNELQAQLNQLSSTLKKQQQTQEKLNIELDSLREELVQQQSNLARLESNLKELSNELSAAQTVLAEKKELFDGIQHKLAQEKERHDAQNNEILSLVKEKSFLSKSCNEIQLELTKVKHKVKSLISEKANAKQTITCMNDKYDWIQAEKHLFGKVNSDYDWKSLELSVAQHELAIAQAEQEALSSKINAKVLGMFEKAEGQYEELVKKRRIIEADKIKIEEVIQELDRKKNEALKHTWKKVNKDFGSIMNSLLHGVSAKLQPYWQDNKEQDVLIGLEMKVAFNGQWKNSLTELSGGQRSLLALSLILSLLLFKPCPMYILDEIDAALDLSHTQNIGQMLKNHFPHSQFIVVSLKEGMFNNANVLFRTKFIDGVSTVTRTTAAKNNNNNTTHSSKALMTSHTLKESDKENDSTQLTR
jgi:structural maintenance of chromosome 2